MARGQRDPGDPGVIEYDGGLRLAGSSLWLDARRPVPLSFLSHAGVYQHHQRIVTSNATVVLLGSKAADAEALASPMGRQFSLGDIGLELVPAGSVAGSAHLLIEHRQGRVLYCGCAQLEASFVAEKWERRQAEVLVLDCPYDAPPFDFPPRAKVIASILEWTIEVIAQNATPLLLARSPGPAQELCLHLSRADLPVRAHQKTAAWCRLVKEAGFDVGKTLSLRKPTAGGEVVIAPPEAAGTPSLGRLAPKARVALVSGRAVVEPDVDSVGAEIGFPLSCHADARALRRLAKETGAEHVYLGPRHSRAFEVSLKRLGIGVTRFGGPAEQAQLDLF